jgi:hypothetical protein
MQLQMEVCNLDQCDFLENKFSEFDRADEFYDSLYQGTILTTIQGDEIPQFHGILLQFQHASSETPKYIYHIWDPATETNPEADIEQWAQETIRAQFDAANVDIYGHKDIRFIQRHYWRLDVYSCILVERDRAWFQNNVEQFRALWDIVLRERVEGYEHRAPKRRDAAALAAAGAQQTVTIDNFFTSPTAAADVADPNIKTITYTPSGKYDSTDNVYPHTSAVSPHPRSSRQGLRAFGASIEDKYSTCMF